MEPVGTRIRQRISELHLGVPEKEIAASVGMTPDVLSRSLNGKRVFTSIELAHLAERLSTSMYWLATGEADPFEARIAARHEYDFASGRYFSDQGESTRKTLDSIELAYRQVYTGRNDVPTQTAAPEEVRARLGEDFVGDFAARVEQFLDIDVVRVEGVTSAYSIRAGGRYCIVVPRSGNWFRQNSDIAHELGHIYLGHFNATDEDASDAKEGPAFDFAAELLLPESLMRTINWMDLPVAGVVNFLWSQGISTKYLANRLRKLRLDIPDATRSLLELSTFDVLNRPLDGKAFERISVGRRTQVSAERRFPNDLVAAHMEAVALGTVPKETLAWMLDVTPEEIEVHPPQSSSIDLDDLAAELGLAAGA
jgi:transcriptional regulator with XRE-family HTH domain